MSINLSSDVTTRVSLVCICARTKWKIVFWLTTSESHKFISVRKLLLSLLLNLSCAVAARVFQMHIYARKKWKIVFFLDYYFTES